MSKTHEYICDHPDCDQRFTEEGRTNVRGRLRIESARLGEKEVEVNMDFCPAHRNEMVERRGLWVPITDLRELTFEGEV